MRNSSILEYWILTDVGPKDLAVISSGGHLVADNLSLGCSFENKRREYRLRWFVVSEVREWWVKKDEEWEEIGSEWEKDERKRGDEVRRVVECTRNGWKFSSFSKEDRESNECEGLGQDFLSFWSFLACVLVRGRRRAGSAFWSIFK